MLDSAHPSSDRSNSAADDFVIVASSRLRLLLQVVAMSIRRRRKATAGVVHENGALPEAGPVTLVKQQVTAIDAGRHHTRLAGELLAQGFDR
uniref:Acyl-desaturase n=1 Tax=Arundo donax TaxID=35708 RepID=A0A0A9ARM9_ARUDO